MKQQKTREISIFRKFSLVLFFITISLFLYPEDLLFFPKRSNYQSDKRNVSLILRICQIAVDIALRNSTVFCDALHRLFFINSLIQIEIHMFLNRHLFP